MIKNLWKIGGANTLILAGLGEREWWIASNATPSGLDLVWGQAPGSATGKTSWSYTGSSKLPRIWQSRDMNSLAASIRQAAGAQNFDRIILLGHGTSGWDQLNKYTKKPTSPGIMLGAVEDNGDGGWRHKAFDRFELTTLQSSTAVQAAIKSSLAPNGIFQMIGCGYPDLEGRESYQNQLNDMATILKHRVVASPSLSKPTMDGHQTTYGQMWVIGTPAK